MRTIAVIQARCGSSRLPGKALRPLAGRPLIAHVIERTRAIPGVDDVVLATTALDRDDLLVETAMEAGVEAVVRGPELDVLTRVHDAATLARADVVVRITGDCPFLDPEVAGLVVRMQRETGWYAWNDTAHSGYPDGTDAEAFPMAVLEAAARAACSRGDREHVTPWIRRHYDVATVYASMFDYSWCKLSVDTLEDYERAVVIARHLPRGDFSLAATMQALQCGCL